MRWPIRLKVAASGVVVTLLISAFVGVYHPAQFRRDALRAKREQVVGTAEMVALSVSIGLRFNEPSAVAAALTWARRDSALVYIAVVDSSGQLFASFDPATLSLDPLAEAATPGLREHNGLYLATAPINFQDLTLGSLVLATSHAPIQKRIADQRTLGLLVSLAVLIVGVLISLFVAERISRSVTALRHAANRIADGDYSTRVAATTGDEIGDLARAFAVMAEKVSAQLEALARQALELAEARDTALEATRAKSAFLATMSHEIRTPMNGVLGMLDLLREERLTAEQLDFAETAYRSADALLTIINDVLDFSKIEAGRLTLETIDFDPVGIVEEVTCLLAERADAKRLDFISDIAPDVPRAVQGDPTRLRQILLNLTGNALKFTEYGSVVVRVSVAERAARAVQLRFEIIDSGIGLSDSDQARLFKPFVQADESTTRRYGGTGLGLVVSRQLATLMGGAVYLQSELGVGSTFGFVLPFTVSSALPATPDLTPLKGRTVLIIDDHDVSRTSLASLLSFWGARPSEAASAALALRALDESGAPDAMLLDVDMAEMDGFALAHAIRAKPVLSNVQLTLLATLSRRGEARRAAESLGCAVLVKPIRQSQLYEALVHNETLKAKRAIAADRAGAGSGRPAAGYVLVAEDNAVNQRVAREVLQRLGYGMDIVANGIAAVEAVRRRTYDAILMDCQMPEMDGFAATAAIRELGSAVPIIALTANASDGDRERCLAAGMNDYVMKPLRRDALQTALNRCIAPFQEVEAASLANESTGEARRPVAIDVERLKLMIGDDVREQCSLLDLFLETSEPVLELIDAALAKRDSGELRRATHNLRGSALSVGAVTVAESAQRMEEIAHDGDWATIARINSDLKEEFARAGTFIQGMKQ
jgi:signal transduction histidine kinase/DNA-binding response OmpR family regulator